jgi:dephospho-CoA kinase
MIRFIHTGMGKSAVTSQLKFLGFPVFDADATVHDLYKTDKETINSVGNLFPDAIENGSVNRAALSRSVIASSNALLSLEAIVHPRVADMREKFYRHAAEKGNFLVVFDVPLLYEKNMQGEFDVVIVVTASKETQRSRVLRRPGMTVEKFEAILSKQLNDSEKRARADFIIDTDHEGFTQAKAQLSKIIEELATRYTDRLNYWKTKFAAPVSGTTFVFAVNRRSIHCDYEYFQLNAQPLQKFKRLLMLSFLIWMIL